MAKKKKTKKVKKIAAKDAATYQCPTGCTCTTNPDGSIKVDCGN
jgi:hypothetical protein